MKFQAEVINSSIKTTDELKKTAEEYESNIKQSAESQAASSGSDANALIAQNIAQYGFTSDQLYEYCMTVAKMEKMQNVTITSRARMDFYEGDRKSTRLNSSHSSRSRMPSSA